MDTKTFLKTILPESGVKYIMRLRPRPGNPKGDATVHEVLADADDVADRVLELDREFANDNIYFAMASYKEAQYKTQKVVDKKTGEIRDFTFIVGRKQDNVRSVKCLWMDWDVGKNSPDSYATREEAMESLKLYLKATNLPIPIIVSSGYGIHTYWVFDEEVSASEWESIAANQRVIMRHLGVKFDPSRDKDSASVLRPPGTRNKKPGKEPQYVKIVKGEVNALPAMEYKRRLRGYVEAHNLTSQVVESAPVWAAGKGNLSDIKNEFPDSYAEIAVNHCAQLKEFAKTGGASEPIWYNVLGLMKHFVDGQRFAHEWGRNYSGYSEEETDDKMQQWEKGPTTCQKFKEINAGGCEGCPHKCTSPIALGINEVLETPNLIEIAATAENAAESVAQAVEDTSGKPEDNGLPLGWPRGFGYDKASDCVVMKVKDENGVWVNTRIATPLVYPVQQIRDEDGTYAFCMHMWVRGKVREFLLPTKYTADARSLKMQLHANQIHVINDKAMTSYLSNYMIEMQRLQEETETYRQMGWKHDHKAWLIGDTLITPTDTKKIALSKAFSSERRALYAPKGNPNQWVSTVDTLYNREFGEPYQFAICAAFAAPLHSLLGFSGWSGIPFALTTNESGYGKTTVNMIANSIWYDPSKGKVSNSTAKAVLGIASEFNNVPFLLDEVTSYLSDPTDMGDLLYALSNGRGREGMKQGGGLRDNVPPWVGVCAMTGNRNILLQVTENKLNPEAMQMRVFEIDLDTYPRISTMDKGSYDYDQHNAEHRLLSETLVNDCCGVIGTEYIRFIMRNLDEVREKLRDTSMKMGRFMDGDATKERFYYNLITTVLVGGYYAKKLGYINFDLKNLLRWCVEHVARMRGAAKEARRTPQDHFAALMSDLVGRILITRNFASLDVRSGKIERHAGGGLRSGIAGRYVVGDNTERAQLYITVSAIQRWCVEQGLSYNSLRRDFMNDGLIRIGSANASKTTGSVRVSIGKGVADIHDLGSPMCLEFDTTRAAGILPKVTAEVSTMKMEAST